MVAEVPESMPEESARYLIDANADRVQLLLEGPEPTTRYLALVQLLTEAWGRGYDDAVSDRDGR